MTSIDIAATVPSMDLDAAFTQAKQFLLWELEELWDEYHPDGMTVSEVEMDPQAIRYFRYLVDALKGTLADIPRDEADETFEDEAAAALSQALNVTFNG